MRPIKKYPVFSIVISIIILIVIIMAVLFFAGCLGKKEEQSLHQEQQPSASIEGDKEKIAKPAEPQLPGAILVMFDNLKTARPQSGLDKADLVYEIVAESGITRFMALFYQQKVEKIGPIRSTRDYFVQLVKGYDAPLAHAGGSQAALELIRKIGMKDLDEIYNSGAYFWRDKERKMPHNLYSSTDKLLKGAKDRGYKVEPPFLQPVGTSWQGEPYEGDLDIDYSLGKYAYKVTWRYNKNKYERKINGSPHLMEDGTLVIADNIMVMIAKTKTYLKDGVPLSDIKVIGKGETLYYINGVKTKGYWQKESNNSPIKFYQENGELMKLKQGKTWIQVVPHLKSIKEN